MTFSCVQEREASRDGSRHGGASWPAALLLVGLAACSGTEKSTPEFWPTPEADARPDRLERDASGRPVVDSSTPRIDAETPDIADVQTSGSCSLQVSVKTESIDGQYSPRNVGAIWITDASGAFVKTVVLWARQRTYDLPEWLDSSGENTVDAVTSATKSTHNIVREGTWNCTDQNRLAVPDGTYTLRYEMSEGEQGGPTSSVEFTKGSKPFTLMPADERAFTKRTLVFEP